MIWPPSKKQQDWTNGEARRRGTNFAFLPLVSTYVLSLWMDDWMFALLIGARKRIRLLRCLYVVLYRTHHSAYIRIHKRKLYIYICTSWLVRRQASVIRIWILVALLGDWARCCFSAYTKVRTYLVEIGTHMYPSLKKGLLELKS